jgi:hypothetical protein
MQPVPHHREGALRVADDGFPIVIYGAARSGTTYLNHVLNRHPEVFISTEERLFIWMHASLRVLPGHRDFFPGDHVISDSFRRYLRAAYPRLIRDYYRQVAPQARYWGDKFPHYASPTNQGTLETTHELFPDCRFIHIIRDGRDVVASNVKGQTFEFDDAHVMWKTHIRYGQQFGRVVGPGLYYELKYEDLVADDVGVMRQLFRWLGIPFAAEVEAFCEEQAERRTPFRSPSRDLTEGAARSHWASVLSPPEQLRSLEMFGKELVQLGYETEESLGALKGDLQRAAV